VFRRGSSHCVNIYARMLINVQDSYLCGAQGGTRGWSIWLVENRIDKRDED